MNPAKLEVINVPYTILPDGSNGTIGAHLAQAVMPSLGQAIGVVIQVRTTFVGVGATLSIGDSVNVARYGAIIPVASLIAGQALPGVDVQATPTFDTIPLAVTFTVAGANFTAGSLNCFIYYISSDFQSPTSR